MIKKKKRRRKRRKTRDRIVFDKKSLRKSVRIVRTRVLADIKEIRLLWARGMSDIEIREELGLVWRQWKHRVKVMRSTPADQDVISIAKKYERAHTKTIASLQHRVQQLMHIHDKAMETVTVYDDKEVNKKTKKPKVLYDRPRDMALAASTARDLATLDREILKAEQEFINMKQRLGMIEEPPPDSGSVFDQLQPIRAPNLMKAWELRKKMIAERKKLSGPNGSGPGLEEARIVSESDEHGPKQETAG